VTSATKDKPLSAQPRRGFLYFAAAVAPLSGLLFGYDTGVVSSALLFLKTHYHLSPAMQQGRADDAAEPAPFVRVRSVDSSNDVLSWRVYFWAKPHKAVEVETVSETLARIKCNLYDAGIPTPTSTSATILRRSAPVPPGNGESG